MEKKVLHFQIPEHMLKNNDQNAYIARKLREKFSDKYEIIVSPWMLQANNCTTFTLNKDASIDDFIKFLEGLDNDS